MVGRSTFDRRKDIGELSSENPMLTETLKSSLREFAELGIFSSSALRWF
jgi:hypothetical protein